MILLPQPYFVLMLYSMDLLYNPIRTSKSPQLLKRILEKSPLSIGSFLQKNNKKKGDVIYDPRLPGIGLKNSSAINIWTMPVCKVQKNHNMGSFADVNDIYINNLRLNMNF